ncbi:MAG: PolC-type DNA polymerase III [Lachnospiraceae bacterium]|nr:PolC-type DNA polymerase III [Lachnospiraceae bacterium]
MLRKYSNSRIRNVNIKLKYSFARGKSFDELWDKYHTYLDDELEAYNHLYSVAYRNSKVTTENGMVKICLDDKPLLKNIGIEMCVKVKDIWQDMFDQSIDCVPEWKPDSSGDSVHGADVDTEGLSSKTENTHDRYARELEEYMASLLDMRRYHEYENDTQEGYAKGIPDSRESSGEMITNSEPGVKMESGTKTADGSGKKKRPAGDNVPEPKKAEKQKEYFKAKSDGFGQKAFRNDKDSSWKNSAFKRKSAPVTDPEVIFGSNVEGEVIKIADIIEESDDVVFDCTVLNKEPDVIALRKNPNSLILSLDVTDFTYSIKVKFFINKDEYDNISGNFKQGSFLRIKGHPEYDDKFLKEVLIQHVKGIKPIKDFRVKRMDNAEIKRIELHCHTKMSEMDGVASISDIMKTAIRWGHKGLAITDHGVVQAYTEAFHTLDKLMDKAKKSGDEEELKKLKNFKIIYGCEGYLVDDEPDEVIDDKGHVLKKRDDGTYAVEDLMKMHRYHIIILCKNDIGRINLYRLISDSHLKYYSRSPRIPKSELAKYREGLIIGSACEAGELFRAIVHNKPEEEIMRVSSFYDYYEIQQVGNNMYMIEDDHFPEINDISDLKRVNKQIVELAEAHGKMCVATCDVHFLEPEDEVYRRILMHSRKFSDADHQAPLYMHTTDEMLQECSYLGVDKAYEVVVTNPNRIYDMIERIKPVRPDKCPPVIPDSDKMLREICENKAVETYGENLHPVIRARLDKELNSIIKNGYSVMYIIAQKLVWKSNEDGYLVGSRGSVGSSFVATMAGITEVNPLPAHYYCKKCHYIDFDSDTVKKYGEFSGFDMPDMDCPVCGEPLIKQGQNIPFETFLGFYGDKEPDIDLNFSGEYQTKAHDYTEVIFGAGQTFKAGTVGTVADKTALAYARKYFADHEETINSSEAVRMSIGCVDVKRTTGQHPGGIVVLPLGEDIWTFTPVQHPANKMDVPIVTTHFDYHSIDHNLLKLDILGHDDPTMIRTLEDLTGVDAKSIRMDDEDVISLFSSTEKLGISPSDIGGVDLGSLGLPELGTKFVMQMLRDTRPKNFSDMMKISGLSHGTDVWTGNAQYYIQNGYCTLATAICTRDDIMTYLIRMGVEPGKAFKIMESVRKGKGLTDDMKETMTANNVPEWYIESCLKIKYMFPKAHACAYIMMAIRIGYFKIHYPLAYYAAFFGIRAKAFDYKTMSQGKDKLMACMRDIKKKLGEAVDDDVPDTSIDADNPDNDKASQSQDQEDEQGGAKNKDKDTLETMKIVQEMYARGYEFMPIDIYKVKARHFQVIDGKVMPALTSIQGLGEKAAEQIEYAAGQGVFNSKEDFKKRCKVGDSVVAQLDELGILKDLPDTDQLSLFDWSKG